MAGNSAERFDDEASPAVEATQIAQALGAEPIIISPEAWQIRGLDPEGHEVSLNRRRVTGGVSICEATILDAKTRERKACTDLLNEAIEPIQGGLRIVGCGGNFLEMRPGFPAVIYHNKP